MYDFNVIHILGRLTRDPELRTSQSGTSIAKFGIANNRGKDSDKVSFFDCVAFDKQAEFANSYLKKGKPIIISGSLSQSTWQDKDTGQKRSKVEILVSEIKFLPSTEQRQGNTNERADAVDMDKPSIDDENDIPF
jgi:single-strand DNA-binding protein